ncbi:adaptor protein MecA [Mangrovibacillus cuniculi]|uniref:Adaptor protein n=1 Tax=Mangrovibacillus cuniculi TaxID=2593652 RepID=A0A7S8CB37_9BACI|nr:adaptor protein MecA [Mangrovibacillus cuniculi]QPC46724.1 hypothetical protein G8O30_06985 [Mangrovibacillus cuniculi]
MRVERVDDYRVKFSISFDELQERGFGEDEIWKNSHIWYDLFDEMLDEAEDSFGIVASQTISIEVYSLTIQAIELILTLEMEEDKHFIDEPPLINTQSHQDLLLIFNDFEDLVSLCKRLVNHNLDIDSEWYIYGGEHYLLMNGDHDHLGTLSIVLEYGRESLFTTHLIREYGKQIISESATLQISKYFQ